MTRRKRMGCGTNGDTSSIGCWSLAEVDETSGDNCLTVKHRISNINSAEVVTRCIDRIDGNQRLKGTKKKQWDYCRQIF